MDNIVDFKASTVGDNIKRVVLPFGGFYESLYQSIVDDQAKDMIEDGVSCEEVDALVEAIDYNVHWLGVAVGYADFINEKVEEVTGINISFTQTQIHLLNALPMRNGGDVISSVIDVLELPSLDFMQNFCDEHQLIDFKSSLQQIAEDKLKSGSGFYSSHDEDISKLFDKPYSMWGTVYIECLLTAIVQVLRITEGGNESNTWEQNINDFEYYNFMDHAYIKGYVFIDNIYAPQHG